MAAGTGAGPEKMSATGVTSEIYPRSASTAKIRGRLRNPQDRDIYLLENIFADADSTVAAALMDGVIAGVLADKTRVVVTNFGPCVSAAQRLITLEGGHAIHGGAAEGPRQGRPAVPEGSAVPGDDERWQVLLTTTISTPRADEPSSVLVRI